MRSIVFVGCVGALLFLASGALQPESEKVEPRVEPKPVAPPRPRPWEIQVEATVGGPQRNGKRIQCDLPGELHRRNTTSRGLGNCVFTSIHHAALLQNVPALEEFPRWLIDQGIPGGAYPEKVDDLIPRMCRDRGVDVPHYIQIEGVDLSLLRQACESGRMPGVTYSLSPTGRYGGNRIAHMVNLVNAGDSGWVILDNNFPGADRYEWLSEEEFRRTYTGGRSGWAVILLAPPPPPRPIEKEVRQ